MVDAIIYRVPHKLFLSPSLSLLMSALMAPICKRHFYGVWILQVGPSQMKKNMFIYHGYQEMILWYWYPMGIYPMDTKIYMPQYQYTTMNLYLQHHPTTTFGIFSRLLRLGIHTILCCQSRFLATFALKCSSWCAVNRGTSKRTPCTSLGFEEYESVSTSNTMASRLLEGKFTRFTVLVYMFLLYMTIRSWKAN